MARYPGAETERRIGEDALSAQVSAIFRGCGMREADALVLADSLVQADLRGIHSHGVLRVPDYVEKLTIGGVDPRGRPEIARKAAATAVVDCNNAMGQIGGVFSMREAIARARDYGIGAVAVGGSNHAGTMDYYVRLAIDAGMIGLATTNALPTMAPWGGTEKLIGLNPIGIGIPGGEAGPIVLDVALGATAHGKIRVYHQKGLAIPEGWAFDAGGQPTTDAAKALEGLIQPIGAFKGLGLAICMGVLSSLLSGAGYGLESGNMVDGAIAGADGQFYLAINIEAFEEPGRFRERIDAIIRELVGSAKAPGVESLYAPGMMEEEIARSYREQGIPLNEECLTGLEQAAARLSVPFNLKGPAPT